MKYSPSESRHFDGQRGYGYISIEKFVDAARSVNDGESKPPDYDATGLSDNRQHGPDHSHPERWSH